MHCSQLFHLSTIFEKWLVKFGVWGNLVVVRYLSKVRFSKSNIILPLAEASTHQTNQRLSLTQKLPRKKNISGKSELSRYHSLHVSGCVKPAMTSANTPAYCLQKKKNSRNAFMTGWGSVVPTWSNQYRRILDVRRLVSRVCAVASQHS